MASALYLTLEITVDSLCRQAVLSGNFKADINFYGNLSNISTDKALCPYVHMSVPSRNIT